MIGIGIVRERGDFIVLGFRRCWVSHMLWVSQQLFFLLFLLLLLFIIFLTWHKMKQWFWGFIFFHIQGGGGTSNHFSSLKRSIMIPFFPFVQGSHAHFHLSRVLYTFCRRVSPQWRRTSCACHPWSYRSFSNKKMRTTLFSYVLSLLFLSVTCY